jgi:hypothetical protein
MTKSNLTKSMFNYSISHHRYFPCEIFFHVSSKTKSNFLKYNNNKYHTLSVPATTGIDFLAKYCIRISRRIFFRRNNCIADCEHFRQASIASER